MGLWREVFLTAGIILILCSRSPLFAQVTSDNGDEVFVPFVGCASFGQANRLEAPVGASRSVPISPKDAQALAYYQSGDGIGLLAPRGWYCQGVSGSGGFGLYLSPKPIHNGSSGWEGLKGPVIEFKHISSENSGRYEIAGIMARVFPAYRAFAAGVMERMDFPLPSGPYPKDTLIYKGETIVEYNTPARTEGLGNFDSWIGKNNLSIKGVAILVGDPGNVGERTDVLLLSVRVPLALARLAPVIISQVELDTAGAPRK